MPLLPFRARRLLALATAVLAFVILAGATYQGVATALERRQFSHPGQLVDVGGHQLHIHCTGAGSPTVVLEAPATGMSAAWGWVQPALAETNRVCSYDRAGLGWSEAGDSPYDPARVPEDLHALLERSGEGRPIVLAGHGLGAAFARMYAGRYPSETAAIVLIDPPWTGGTSAGAGGSVSIVELSPWLARAGILRATGALSRRAIGLPGASGGAMRAFLNRPDHLTRMATELDEWTNAIRLATITELHRDLTAFTVTAAGPDATALLTRREDADQVARAIAAAAAQARAQLTK